MSITQTLEISGNISSRVLEQQRIGVTELARSSAWRERLASCKMLEVIERGTTVGWLLSQEGMNALLDTISYYEAEAERAQMACLVELRKPYADWKSGEDLHRAIDEKAESSLSEFRAAF